MPASIRSRAGTHAALVADWPSNFFGSEESIEQHVGLFGLVLLALLVGCPVVNEACPPGSASRPTATLAPPALIYYPPQHASFVYWEAVRRRRHSQRSVPRTKVVRSPATDEGRYREVLAGRADSLANIGCGVALGRLQTKKQRMGHALSLWEGRMHGPEVRLPAEALLRNHP